MNEDRDEVKLGNRALDEAEALMELGRYEQAVPLLAKSLAQSPDDAHLHCRLADAWFALEDMGKAQDFAHSALHLDPNSDHAHFRLTWISLRQHNYTAALQHAQAAISIDTDDPANLYALACAEYHNGHHQRALQAAQQAIQLNPEHAALHELLADLYFGMGKHRQAEMHYREALRHDAGSASIHWSLGQCLAYQTKIHEAAEHIFAAVKLEPGEQRYRDALFDIVHHDVLGMSTQNERQALEQLDPAIRHFYQDQLSERGHFHRLRLSSLVTLWLLVLSAMMLLFAWITGEDIRNLTRFVLVIAAVYAALFVSNRVIRLKADRHEQRR